MCWRAEAELTCVEQLPVDLWALGGGGRGSCFWLCPQPTPQFGAAEAAIERSDGDEVQKDAAFVATVRQALARAGGGSSAAAAAAATTAAGGAGSGAGAGARDGPAVWQDPLRPAVPPRLARQASGADAAVFLPSNVRCCLLWP